MSAVHVRRSIRFAPLLAFAACVALLAIEPASSAPIVRTWTGNGANNNWTTAANWDAGPPVEGDMLVFPAVANRKTNTNDFPNFTEFLEITIEGAGYTLSGNRAVVLDFFTHDPGAGVNTVSFIIDGDGNLLQQSGRLELTAANSHAGDTIVSGGELYVAHTLALGEFSSTLDIYGGVATIAAPGTYFQPLDIGGASAGLAVADDVTWNGPVQFFGQLELNVQQNMTFEIVSAITGGGTPTKFGGGTLFLSGDNSFAGVLEIEQGTVRVNRNTSLGSDLDGTVVADGAVLELESAVSIADEFIQIDGFLNNASGVNHLGRVLLGEDATFHVGEGILRLPNGVDEAADDLVLEKTGDGTLELEGAGDFAGTIQLTEGVLSVRGDVQAGVVIEDGTLTGDGFIGAVTGVSGYLIPGVGSGGTLTIEGPLSLTADMWVDFVLESGAQYTQLRVEGPVTLDSPTLYVGGAGAVPEGVSATLILNNSAVPIDGEFLLRPEGSSLGVGNGDVTFFDLTYDGGPDPANDFVMTPESGDQDIAVTIAGTGASAPASVYSFDVRVRNFSDQVAAAMLLELIIPNGASFMSSGDGIICSFISEVDGDDIYDCSIPAIAAGAIREFEVVVAITAPAATQLLFEASVEAKNGDPPANNSAEHTVNVAAGGLGYRIGLPAVARDGGW